MLVFCSVAQKWNGHCIQFSTLTCCCYNIYSSSSWRCNQLWHMLLQFQNHTAVCYIPSFDIPLFCARKNFVFQHWWEHCVDVCKSTYCFKTLPCVDLVCFQVHFFPMKCLHQHPLNSRRYTTCADADITRWWLCQYLKRKTLIMINRHVLPFPAPPVIQQSRRDSEHWTILWAHYRYFNGFVLSQTNFHNILECSQCQLFVKINKL